jgi:DNA repair exonuclease SbcCD ATPase subunit
MTDNNSNQLSDNLASAELGERPISPEDVEALIASLGHASVNNQATLQPIMQALEKLMVAQVALKKEVQTSNEKMLQQIAQQQQKLDRQSKEIEKLQQQLERQDNWLRSLVHWRTIATCTILAGTVIAGCLALLQKFLPPQLDTTTMEKIDFLYSQEAKRLPKTKKSVK